MATVVRRCEGVGAGARRFLVLQIRMDELAKLVGQSSVQKSVLSAYGDQGGFVLAPQDNLF